MASRGFNHIQRELSHKLALRKNTSNGVFYREMSGMCTGSHISFRSWTWSQTTKLKEAWQRLQATPQGCRLKKVFHQTNEYLNVVALLFARQCNAIAALRIRRGAQIANLYSRLYGKQTIQLVVEKCHTNRSRNPLTFLLGAVLFSWDQQKFSDSEINVATEELASLRLGNTISPKDQLGSRLGGEWEQVINRDHLAAWRRPIPDSYLYEYKVYGSFKDIPARAFFNVQVDLEYRKRWDKLVIHLDLIDKDEDSGSEVIRWVTHFPYPMYSREYIFLRKYMIDYERKVMVFMSHGTNHPSCPVLDKYVRVHQYKSNMLIRPTSGFDENGFDYIVTYYDDPQAAFPSAAVRWMAAKGVPDFVDKLHRAAKLLHESESNGEDQTESESDRLPM